MPEKLKNTFMIHLFIKDFLYISCKSICLLWCVRRTLFITGVINYEYKNAHHKNGCLKSFCFLFRILWPLLEQMAFQRNFPKPYKETILTTASNHWSCTVSYMLPYCLYIHVLCDSYTDVHAACISSEAFIYFPTTKCLLIWYNPKTPHHESLMSFWHYKR